jgi:SAM-dependent methyltransferase
MIAPHPIAWTPASIARFWNLYESTGGMDLWHFSKQRGAALMRYVANQVDIMEPILDLGSGSGHLIGLLLRKNLQCFAADVSSKGLEITAARFSGQSGFLGARFMDSNGKIPFNDASIGTVFLLETIEHLLPDALEALLAEIPRVLSKDGYLIITTPWNEDLRAGCVECAQCGCMFHKTQHLRKNNEASVTATVEKAGLQIVSCEAALLLPDFGVWLHAQMTPSRISVACPECGSPCVSPNRSVFARWKSMTHELKHLVCIARKK